jgi:hypothetical protein
MPKTDGDVRRAVEDWAVRRSGRAAEAVAVCSSSSLTMSDPIRLSDPCCSGMLDGVMASFAGWWEHARCRDRGGDQHDGHGATEGVR